MRQPWSDKSNFADLNPTAPLLTVTSDLGCWKKMREKGSTGVGRRGRGNRQIRNIKSVLTIYYPPAFPILRIVDLSLNFNKRSKAQTCDTDKVKVAEITRERQRGDDEDERDAAVRAHRQRLDADLLRHNSFMEQQQAGPRIQQDQCRTFGEFFMNRQRQAQESERGRLDMTDAL
jgi:hypothetical protein